MAHKPAPLSNEADPRDLALYPELVYLWAGSKGPDSIQHASYAVRPAYPSLYPAPYIPKWFGLRCAVALAHALAPQESELDWEEWMDAVDEALWKEVRLTHRDIADFPYRDAFDSEEDPEVVAISALEEDGLFL